MPGRLCAGRPQRVGVANRHFPWDDANRIQHARANFYAIYGVSHL